MYEVSFRDRNGKIVTIQGRRAYISPTHIVYETADNYRIPVYFNRRISERYIGEPSQYAR